MTETFKLILADGSSEVITANKMVADGPFCNFYKTSDFKVVRPAITKSRIAKLFGSIDIPERTKTETRSDWVASIKTDSITAMYKGEETS